MLSMIVWLVPLELVLLAGLLALHLPSTRVVSVERAADWRFTPHLIAVLTTIAIWYVWGSLRQIPVVHDEASYLLQAETFARGHWVMPSPPLPAFFEQFHVFVTPTFASKYPPGHGIMMVPGIWMHLPGIVPLLLNGLAAALLFVLVRRVTNGWVALLTVVLWLPMKTNLLFRPSYFSENTSSVLWLLGWWALLEWRAHRLEKWLLLLAGCTAWMAITRPLTALAFAIPVAALVVRDAVRMKNWRQLGRPALVGVAIFSLLPISSAMDTGNWRVSPYSLYARDYMPFDKLGFGLDTTSPRRALPADIRDIAKVFGPIHAAHTPAHLPRVLYDRWRFMFADAFRGARLPLAIFAVVALAALPAAGWFAVASSLILTLCYLGYAHDASWDVYYLEILPLFPFLTACGIWAVWVGLARRGKDLRTNILSARSPQAAFAAAVIALVLLLPAGRDVMQARREQASRRAYQLAFSEAVAKLPDAQSIVFVRYAPRHFVHTSLIANHADLSSARTWLVYDRGAEDAELMALAPERVAYLFDERSGTLTRLSDRASNSP